MPVKSIFVFAKRLYTQKVDGQKKVTDVSLDRTHDTPWTAQLSEKGLKDLKFCIEQSGFKGDASRVAFQQACWGDMTQGGTGIPMDYLATAIMAAKNTGCGQIRNIVFVGIDSYIVWYKIHVTL